MGSLGPCCQPTSMKAPEIIEINKTLTVQCPKDKEKPEITVYVTTGSLNKNMNESHLRLSEEKETENIIKTNTVEKDTNDKSPNNNSNRKKRRKSIEIIHQILNDQELEKLKALLLKVKFLYDEMDDSTIYIRVKEGKAFYDLVNKTNDEEYIYIIDKGKCKVVLNSSTSNVFIKNDVLSTYDLINNSKETVESLVIKAEGRAYLYMFSYHKLNSILKDFKENMNEEVNNVLKQIYIFRYHDKKIMTSLIDNIEIKKYKKRTVIIAEDMEINHLFIVAEGFVLCSKGDSIIRKLPPLSVFNEIGLFNQISSYYGYHAEKGTVIYHIKYAIINSLCKNKIVFPIFSNAIKKSSLLSKYFSTENINTILPVFQFKYYYNEVIIKKKQKKLLIPVAGMFYRQGNDRENQKIETGVLGELFGEYILHQSNISQCIISTIECVVLEADWNDILKALRCYYNKSFTLYEKISILHSCDTSYFKRLSELKLFRIAEELKLIKFKDNELILSLKSPIIRLYVILKGNVSVMINDAEVKRLKEGETFGFFSFAQSHDKPHPNFISRGLIECFYIDKELYEEITDEDIIKPFQKLKNSKTILPITMDQLFYDRDLGKGSYGNVYLVNDRKQDYAMKTAEIESLKENHASAQCYLNEKTIMSSIEHPFIVKLYNTYKTREYIFFLLEYVQGITLRQFLEKQSKKNLRNLPLAQFYGAILCSILNYLGSRRIIHRDIKPENLIVESANGYIKAIDFGIAKDLAGRDYTSTVIGTMWYLAPEIIQGKDYSFSIDYWSVGIVLYEIYYGLFPFGFGEKDPVKIYKEITDMKLSLPSDPKNEIFNDFVGKLLNKNPNKRIHSFSECKDTLLYLTYDFDKLLQRKIEAPPNDVLLSIDPPILNKKEIMERNTLCPFNQYLKNNIFCSSTDLSNVLDNNKEDFLSEF